MSSNFNRITLRIKDKEQEPKFFDFAMEDVYNTIPYFTLMSGLLFTPSLLLTIFTQKIRMIFLWHLAELILYVLALFLRPRLKNNIIYYLYLLYLTTMAGIYLGAVYESSNLESQLNNESSENPEKFQLRESFEYWMRTILFFILFGCPTTKMFFAYLVPWVLCVILLSFHKGDFNDDIFLQHLAQQPIYLIVSFITIHVMQTRQLFRFFKQLNLAIQGE